ncbi:hypothetical protein [Pelosinus propionicus]|uniref:Uncharacterized protein n=1 Tax=Pelosinus propionicus DSM 13327 TaxID=1123291 RepID=A0A1I4KE85_9FIRM|nr:hypothetical protein [Pelosinus propionicus]SFL76776.1 hypothetical protein SAMN04490355_10173 [Pelosinus propionicus DSM 13327]
MRGKSTILVLVLAFLLGGCASQRPAPTAALSIAGPEESMKWGLSQQLQQEGAGNSYRVMTAQGQGTMLELAAGNQGKIVYFVEAKADAAIFANLRLKFLSTQGGGRIVFSAFDNKGNLLGETGSIFTGKLSPDTAHDKWQDRRYYTNYQGGWIEENHYFAQVLAAFPEAAAYRVSVQVSEGQHVLISQLTTGYDHAKAVAVTPRTLQYAVKQGEMVTIEADVENRSQELLENVSVRLQEPFGYGLVAVEQMTKTIERLAPWEKQHVSWQVQAQRPDSVNLNKPWSIGFRVNDVLLSSKIQVAVADTRPGKVFYVMTEDLEPIDGAGYAKAWGNANGWLDPQEFLGQMVFKAERINEIAEKHGAKWTHYIAWPAVKAAQWAAGQSALEDWSKVIAAITNSVIQEAAKGHEYGIHMHSDYDPYLPGNTLSYNDADDGFWANHLKHGWAHSIEHEGNFSDYNSRTGILYQYQAILDQLSSNSSQGQLLTARAGSFDFGNGSTDEAMSTNAYKKVGLWGSSDADGNAGGITSGEYGKEIYLAADDDINIPAKELQKTGVVEFRPTPKEPIAYDSQSAAVMNGKADQGMKYFTEGDSNIKPGVHAIVGFTHAMFIMGQGDWQSLEGGQFKALDDHLAYLKESYVNKGLLTFGTASELVADYLDYYTPQLLAIYGARRSDNFGVAEYNIRILGRDIPVDENHIHSVSMKYPLYLRDSAYRISILKNGKTIYSTWGLPTPFNDILFTVDDKTAVYTVKIYHNELAAKFITQIRSLNEKIFKKK